MPLLFTKISNFGRIIPKRPSSSLFSSNYSSSAQHFRVTLDGDTLYIEQPLAEALGWKADLASQGVSLNLTGWAPHYFVIAPSNSETDLLARGTVESAHNRQVQGVLQRLKDFDATTDEDPAANEQLPDLQAKLFVDASPEQIVQSKTMMMDSIADAHIQVARGNMDVEELARIYNKKVVDT